ncbi:MAG: hypothetical protein NT028_03035 [candidate division Zixibacteria bacterium]|nr:hypothetical protein [candidate division Zixibacteria bacterium]
MDTRARAIGRRGFVNLSAPEECLKCGSTDLVDDSLPKRQSKEPSREVSDLGAQFAHAGKEWENAYSLGLREAQEGIMTHYHSTEATKKKMEKQIERLIAEARTKGVLDDVLHLLQRKGEKAALYVIDHYL